MGLKHRIKLRLIYNYTLQEFDGLYYFGLNDAEYATPSNEPVVDNSDKEVNASSLVA